MELSIKASKEFEEFLKRHESFGKVEKREEIKDENDFYSKFSTGSQIVLNIVISVFSPFITDAIKDFIETTKQEVVVTTESEQYVITPANVKDLTPLLHNDLVATIDEDNDGKDR